MMKRAGLAWFVFGAGFLSSAAAFGLSTQLDSLPSLMSRGDYAAARQVIASDTRQAIGACRALAPDARARCKVRAHARERVARADLAARYYGTVAAAREAQQARVRASYDVARADCAGHVGRERSACVAAARQAQDRAVALAHP
jgi:hypothetical protein